MQKPDRTGYIFGRDWPRKGKHLKIIQKNTADLIPYDKNPRKNDAAVDEVAASIRQFGFKVPIIIDADQVIVAGHTRLKAAEQLGLKKVPCIVADDLTEEQIKAFRLADNKTAELADWDFELLTEELEEITDIDMADFGFDLEEVAEGEDMTDEFEDTEKLESHYGVPYQGNKSRIADIIISLLPEGRRLVDLFGGGVQLLTAPCSQASGTNSCITI